MSHDLPAFISEGLRRAAKDGLAPRRLIVILNLPEPAPGSNARVVDITHHLNFEDVIADPGVLGAIAQSAVRKPDA